MANFGVAVTDRHLDSDPVAVDAEDSRAVRRVRRAAGGRDSLPALGSSRRSDRCRPCCSIEWGTAIASSLPCSAQDFLTMRATASATTMWSTRMSFSKKRTSRCQVWTALRAMIVQIPASKVPVNLTMIFKRTHPSLGSAPWRRSRRRLLCGQAATASSAVAPTRVSSTPLHTVAAARCRRRRWPDCVQPRLRRRRRGASWPA